MKRRELIKSLALLPMAGNVFGKTFASNAPLPGTNSLASLNSSTAPVNPLL